MGSGSSFSLKKSKSHEITKDQANKLPSIISQEKKRLDNFEPFTLVCLDNNINDNDQEFRSIIDYIYCFNDIEECEEFILNTKTINYDQLFFIVSNEYVTNIISHIHDLPQIISIYILQENTSNKKRTDIIDDRWTKRYPKVKGIYLDRHILLKELSSDVKTYTDIGDLLPITVYSHLDIFQPNNLSNDHLRFLFYQLFLHDYCLNSSSLNKTNLIEIIEDYYRLNENELKHIDEFIHDYQSKKHVLSWFLRESFLRRLLTKSLLILDLKILFALRFFLKDMFKTMIDIGLSSNKSRLLSNEQIFYRSQVLSKNTFERIKSNIDELLSFNNFFLANQNRHDSLIYLRQNLPTSKLIYRILFEIKISSDYIFHKQRPFIDITHLTSTKNTILFFIGSIFQINTVVFDINNDCWIIQLLLYDERINNDFSQIFSYLNENHNPIILANLLRQISPNSAEHFYKHLLKENSEFISKQECYHGIGLCLYSREDYEQALIYFSKALEMKSNDQFIKSSLHNSLGLVYAQQDDIDQAYTHFSKALKTSLLPLHSACIHHNLALIYSKQGLYNQELNHYQEAFDIRINQLPENHLQMASLLNNIGIAYSDMQKYDDALINLRKALEMRLKLLPDNHIDVARNYANIGAVYVKTEEYRMALEYFNKAQILLEHQQSIPDEDIKQINNNIKFVNDKLRRKSF
ncbi:unnamed protein product [Adineta steineri]|uniref:Uncharacterized protein n=1 Tax=Adineta steineri TaxID=433720 RepID=A0A813VLQ1_9BILA|nr:unnamed protein product [Adineta steineri]CAF0919772.1 unnamed protein product [Adineta steineri]